MTSKLSHFLAHSLISLNLIWIHSVSVQLPVDHFHIWASSSRALTNASRLWMFDNSTNIVDLDGKDKRETMDGYTKDRKITAVIESLSDTTNLSHCILR